MSGQFLSAARLLLEAPPRARGADDLGPAIAESSVLWRARLSGVTDPRCLSGIHDRHLLYRTPTLLCTVHVVCPSSYSCFPTGSAARRPPVPLLSFVAFLPPDSLAGRHGPSPAHGGYEVLLSACCPKPCRSISHLLSRVTSGGDAVYCLSGAGRLACTDVGLFAAVSCPWPPSSTCYTLRAIERSVFAARQHHTPAMP